MAYYTTETEVCQTTNVELEIEITVQDQDGNEFECDIDGNDLELRAQIDTSKIKEEMEEVVREDLRQEVEDQYISDIAESINPFNELADLIAKVGNAYKIRQERSQTSLHIANNRNFDKSNEITRLKDEKEVLEGIVDALKLRVNVLTKEAEHKVHSLTENSEFGEVPAKIKVHLDPPKEDK